HAHTHTHSHSHSHSHTLTLTHTHTHTHTKTPTHTHTHTHTPPHTHTHTHTDRVTRYSFPTAVSPVLRSIPAMRVREILRSKQRSTSTLCFTSSNTQQYK